MRAHGSPVACGGVRACATGAHVGELKRLWVEPAWRRAGIARLLVGALERRAGELGYRRVALNTGVRQHAAIALYDALGYDRAQPFGPHAADPELLFFEKDL